MFGEREQREDPKTGTQRETIGSDNYEVKILRVSDAECLSVEQLAIHLITSSLNYDLLCANRDLIAMFYVTELDHILSCIFRADSFPFIVTSKSPKNTEFSQIE